MDQQRIAQALPHAFDGIELPFLGQKTSGKVRDIYTRGDRAILITTDRLSAFDRILGLIPYKGQVLNQLSAFWFTQTADIIGNHFIELPDPNVIVARKCRPLPVEVVVRGYISGVTATSLWYRYSQGERNIYGIDFPDGLRKNDPLPEPIITPTTKARPEDAHGGHDERITSAEVVERGLVDPETWIRVQDAAVDLFQRGQALARRAGLILVDTKYEFGLAGDDEVLLIDEIHTPDSSRFWTLESYKKLTTENTERTERQEPENFDKEFIRLYYAARGYRGEGEPFALPADLAVQAAQRYIRTYELITGREFEPRTYPVGPQIERNLREWMKRENVKTKEPSP